MSSICFVSYYSYPLLFPELGDTQVGGAEVQQHHLAAALDQVGVRVSFVVGNPPKVRSAGPCRYAVHRSYDRSRGVPLLRSIYPQFFKTWLALRRADSEIYYVRGAQIESVVAWLFCWAYGRRFVAAIAHDRECDPSTLPFPFWKPKHHLYFRSLRGAWVVLAQTEHQKAMLARTVGVEAAVLRNIVPTAPSACSGPDRLQEVLWVGSIKPSKRPELFLDLAARFPTLDLTMVGSPALGHWKYRERVRAVAKALANVRFVDNVPIDRIEEYFRRCDLLVVTSQSEGFPNVLLQAWSCGRPVLTAFDPDGVVRGRRMGWVARDFAEFESVLSRLQADATGAELREMGRNGRAYVEHNHIPDRIVPEFCALVGIRDTRTES